MMVKIKPPSQFIQIIVRIGFLFISSRIILVLIGVLSRRVLGMSSPIKFENYSNQGWLNIWGIWDTGWYLDIAQYGYSPVLHRDPVNFKLANYAFFPLYPVLIKAANFIVKDYFITGLLISNLAFFVTCYYLYQFVLISNDNKIAFRAVKYLFLFPTAFILSGVFSESLYLMLAVMTFYYARRKQWLLVGTTGFLLSLTRNLGFLIFLPVLYEYFSSIKFKLQQIKPNIFFLLLIPLGLFLYSFFIFKLTGDFLAFVKIQASWGRHLANPILTLINGIIKPGSIGDSFSAWFSLLILTIIIVFSKNINFSLLLYCLYSLIIPLSTGVLHSIPRFSLVLFPIPILLAQLTKDQEADQLTTISLALFQGFLMAIWVNGIEWLIM